jgi:hypothetical protein
MRTAFYGIHLTRIRTIVERSTGRLPSAWSLAQQSMGRSMPRNNFGRRIQKQLTSTVGLILLAGAPSGNGHLENKATRRFSTLQDGQRRRWPALTRLFPTKSRDIGTRFSARHRRASHAFANAEPHQRPLGLIHHRVLALWLAVLILARRQMRSD